MNSVLADLRFALRGFRRNPGFTAVAVLVLALGIGATSAIFSVVNAVVLRPLPYGDPDRLVTLLGAGRHPVAPANFLDWRAQNRVFAGVGAAEGGPGAPAALTAPGSRGSEAVRSLQVTADLFSVLGVDPLLGRTFLPGEDRAGAGRVVMLSHGLWQRRFGADPGLVGRTILLDEKSYTVVGIMPPRFKFAPFWIVDTELWTPLDLTPRQGDRAGASLRVFARLRPGVTLGQAQTEMDTIARRLASQYPATNWNDLEGPGRVLVTPLHETVVGKVRPSLLVLLAGVTLVLLIACANVANLLLARSVTRRSEMGIRTALGASRWRLVRQLLTESALLGVAGGGLALLLAARSVDLLVALSPPTLPRAGTISLDGRVVIFTLVVALLTTLVFGLLPALQAARQDPGEVLGGGSRSATEGLRRNRLRGLLVIAEVALALVMLIGAGLAFRSFSRLVAVDAGFDPRHLLTMTVAPGATRHGDGARRAAFFQQLLDRVKAIPGVEAASAINHLPLGGDMWTRSVTADDRPLPPPGHELRAVYRITRPDYLRTAGMSLLSGRDFTDADRTGTPGVAIVNEAFARVMWPAENPLGKRIRLQDGGPDPRTVVGVVKDARQREWATPPAPEMYLAYLQNPAPRYLTLVVRTAGDPLALAPAVQNEVWALDDTVPASRSKSMERVVADSLGEPRFNLMLLNLFGVVALLLAAVGIYGVVAYSAGRRTREMGIRLALGARAAQVVKLVVGQGMALTVLGVAIGLLTALATTRLMSALLYGVSPTDPLTFVVTPLVLVAVGLLACYLPARRATRIDPTVALRHD